MKRRGEKNSYKPLRLLMHKLRLCFFTILSLWVVVASLAIGGCKYFGKEESPKEAEGRLVAPKARGETPNFVTVERKGQKAVRVVLTESGWLMKTPLEFPAHEIRMEKIIWNISRLRSEKVLLAASEEKRKNLGLNKPCMKLEVGRLGQWATKITVGCSAPKGLIAMSVDGEKDVHLVQAKLKQLGGALPRTFMSPRLTLASMADINVLSISHPKEGKLKLQRKKEDLWILKGQWGKLPADTDQAFKLAKVLIGWRAKKIIKTGKDALKGLPKKGGFRIVVQEASSLDKNPAGKQPKNNEKTKKPKPAAINELVISGECPDEKGLVSVTRIRPYPANFCLEKKALSSIGFSRIEYLEKRPITADPLQIGKLEWWKNGALRFRLVMGTSGHWWFDGGKSRRGKSRRQADTERVKSVLSFLSKKSAVSFQRATDTKGSAKGNCFKYFLRGSSKQNIFCQLPAQTKEKHVVIRRQQEPLAVVVPQKVATILKMEPDQFRSRLVFKHRLASFPNLLISRNGVMEQVVRSGSYHKLKTPVFGCPNPSAYSKLSSLFSHFSVERYVSFSELKKKMKKPSVILEVKPKIKIQTKNISTFSRFLADLADLFVAGSKAMKLSVGGRAKSGGCYGQMEDMAFILPEKSCKALMTPLASRQIIQRFRNQVIGKITLCKNKKCRNFENNEVNKWVEVPKSNKATLSQSSVRNLLAIALGIRALKVECYTKEKSRPEEAGHLCLTRKKKQGEEHLGVHESARAFRKICLYVGKKKVKAQGENVRRFWVKNRPVIYLVPELQAKRLFKPF